jgi:hypothetical protein
MPLRGVFMRKIIAAFFCLFLLAGSPAMANEGAEEGKAPGHEVEYFEIAPLIVPIITDKGLTRQVSMVVMLEIPGGKTEEIKNFKPRLMDAYIRDLYGAMGAGHILMRANIVDVEALRTRLVNVTERIVGKELVKDVLLQAVTQYAIKG